ncbi:LOW QUALITY PROTEIN: AP-5 complex subunit mu-1-like [Pomacea canaliculata]|uniref:LOW QUALITY PROTEIN: AP-5 complex subunit mu-1-like n=1 Tax=Pomacea canaliculata TaxID=400727 RepID=UPI000D73F3A1|nr:LOW QUALITY PROTEIN: AP-5 complex subunit mu-1-like [Pomacea canaliculata]
MSIRHLWIIQLPTSQNKSAKVLLSRRYPTVEKKAKLCGGDKYVRVLPDPQMARLLLQEVSCGPSDRKFVAERDSCRECVQKPIFKLRTDEGDLWPLIVLQQSDFLLCCLCLDEKSNRKERELTSIPSVSLGFSLLCAVAEMLRVPSQEVATRLMELPLFLNEAAPFGSVRDGCAESVLAKMTNRPITLPKNEKQAAWKPGVHRGKSSIHLNITEYIRASQCDQEEMRDTVEVYGCVTCRAELEGVSSNIIVNLSHAARQAAVPLDQLTVHPCVLSADTAILSARDMLPQPRRIRFSPPAETFTLCHYSARRLQELPLFGSYNMKMEKDRLQISVLLKLSDQMQNSFEYCELQIPLYSSPPISNVESAPSQGTVALSPDRKILAWNIGQKFPAKTLSVSMTATVNLMEGKPCVTATSAEDQFCVGHNSYCQVYFQVLDFTHTGCMVDSRSVQISPSTKFKLTTGREYKSTDYKIWNSFGEALTVK